jgi:hypothetical protein
MVQGRRRYSNRSLEQEARRLRRGAHRCLREEFAARRDPEREAAVLVEKLERARATD